MSWLDEWVPGYSDLKVDERNEIFEFTLLWMLFENRLLECNASAGKIVAIVGSWLNSEKISPTIFDGQLGYFRARYYVGNDFTHHFEGLNLRSNDCPEMVRSVIRGELRDPVDQVATVLIIVLRFRNNLFHGLKLEYELKGQIKNFRNANCALKQILELAGELAQN